MKAITLQEEGTNSSLRGSVNLLTLLVQRGILDIVVMFLKASY
jgi:hypothetical protein